MKLIRLLQLFVVTIAFAFSNLALAAGATVVYHINDSANARMVLGNITNHLNAVPDTKIHVVSNGKGIDFLLKDAQDSNGKSYSAAIQTLAAKGVAFKVCRNTLNGRKLGDDAVVPEATIVPAAIAEIARLEIEEKAAYIKP
jgi:intracellular sulfur oxidation DsrE/DsrF family protein